MNNVLYNDALEIINYSIDGVMPSMAVKNALCHFKSGKGKVLLVAIGKAAWSMAEEIVKNVDIDEGLVVTKYNHSKGPLKNTKIIEAGHPILDENSIMAAEEAIKMCSNLKKEDTVIMAISGGGSALFESPIVSLNKLQKINDQLIKSGANISEINTIRKRLSKVKGGKFLDICFPARVINIILSDIINDPLDMIASGPTYKDSSTIDDALKIINKYQLDIDTSVFKESSITNLENLETYVTGNNEILKKCAKEKAEQLGYKVIYINEPLISDINIEVEKFKKYINQYTSEKVAIISGGEITVNVLGNGLGGRNQEFALRLLPFLQDNQAFFALGSDGTDGPTDAAGAYVDNSLFNNDYKLYLKNNDSYHYFEKYGGLIKLGPTGTNVCDLYCLLIN